MYGSLSAIAAFTPPPAGTPFSLTAALFFAAIFVGSLFSTLAVAWWMLRAGIIADTSGLCVRRFGGWKSVRWEEVSDFYEVVPVRSGRRAGSGTRFVLEMPSRKIGFSSLWSNAERLREKVAQNAVNSRAAEWEIKGTRRADPWPRTFGYNTWENRWAPRIWLKLFVVFVVYLFVKPALQLAVTAHVIGWTVTLVIAGAYVLLVGSLGLIFLLPLAQYRASNRRKSEQITVDLDGIVFNDGARRVEAAWAEVTGYEVAHGSGVMTQLAVETQHGDFDFLSSLKEAGLLKAIIQRFAIQSANHKWGLPVGAEALGGEAARWTGGKVGAGQRFYHYRTRTNRAVLLGITALSVVSLLLVMCSTFGWLPGAASPGASPSAGTVAAFGIAWGAGLALGWRAYLQNGIALDDGGLTQRMVFGSRYLAWEQVQDFVFRPGSGGKVIGRTQTLGFKPDIAGCAELKAEIKCRRERTKAVT